MGYSASWALPYAVHLNSGTGVSGAVADMTLTPMVFSTSDGALDVSFDLLFRQPYVGKYVEIIASGIPGGQDISTWRVVVWNFTHERWDQTPCMLGHTVPSTLTRSTAENLYGEYLKLDSQVWMPHPESITQSPGATVAHGSYTATITDQHIDSQGRCAVRLIVGTGPTWGVNWSDDYQIVIRAVRGCRSAFPLPKSYFLELTTGWATEGLDSTFELVWDPDLSLPLWGDGGWYYEDADVKIWLLWIEPEADDIVWFEDCYQTTPTNRYETIAYCWVAPAAWLPRDPPGPYDVELSAYLRDSNTKNPRTLGNLAMGYRAYVSEYDGTCFAGLLTAGSE